MSSPNVEWAERNFPLRFLFRRHIKDGGGAGKFRGGVGAELAVTAYDSPEGKVQAVAYGVDGFGNVGRGVSGGYPGAPSILIHFEGANLERLLASGKQPHDVEDMGGTPRLLPYCDFTIGKEDILFYRLDSGGGYGDPLERDPEAVRSDVESELVSLEAARDIYGVAVEEQAQHVDIEATDLLRASLKAKRAEPRS